MFKYKVRPKMHPMVLTVGKEYEVTVGPLITYKGRFVQSTEKGYNFQINGEHYLLNKQIYPDKKCIVRGDSMVFWLPAKYVVVDEWKITVSNFTIRNYNRNWKISD